MRSRLDDVILASASIPAVFPPVEIDGDLYVDGGVTRNIAYTTDRDSRAVRIPDFIAKIIERIAFEARSDRRIDKRSGVSQRMPITVMENVVSNA